MRDALAHALRSPKRQLPDALACAIAIDRERVTLAELYERDRMIDARCMKCGYCAPIRPEWFWIRNRNFPKDSPVVAAMGCIRCTPCRPKRTQIRWRIVQRTIYADQREPR